jgi:hypothetical protein
MKKKSGLTNVQCEGGPGEPVEIAAFDDEIQLHVFFEGEEKSRIVKLRPHHIHTIAAMKEDWWESRWAAVHERES